jgi:hypothetical protein
VFVPKEQTPRAFESIEEIVNYLLGTRRSVTCHRERREGEGAFLMFDEETEQLAGELGLDVAFRRRRPARMDSKIETTAWVTRRASERANTMGRGTDTRRCSRSPRTGLGDDSSCRPYGDSGQTTFFVANEATGVRTRRDRRSRHQGDEADRAARARDRGRDHAPRTLVGR